MSQFHTDEYVDFLHRINPENAQQFAREQVKCELFRALRRRGQTDEQTTSETIVLYLMDYSSTVPFQLVDLWVSPFLVSKDDV
jgi:hypothetical protein